MQIRGIEFTIYAIIMVVGFVLVSNGFKSTDYKAEFTQRFSRRTKRPDNSLLLRRKRIIRYRQSFSHLIAKSYRWIAFMGMDQPLLSAPSWMNGY